jgi:hypothetical protein
VIEMTEQNKQIELTEHLRQYQHNDGSGLVFGYDKDGIDKLFASLSKQPPASAGEGVVAYLIDGRMEQGIAFDRKDAEVMADANCGTVVPLYTSQTAATQAAVAASLLKAAKIIGAQDVDPAFKLRMATHIRSLIPADNMQALRELMIEAMEVARLRCYQKDGNFSMTEIVAEADRILAEKGKV